MFLVNWIIFSLGFFLCAIVALLFHCCFHKYVCNSNFECVITSYLCKLCYNSLISCLNRLERIVLPLCSIWAKCWEFERRYPLDYTMHLSCHLCWRWHCTGSSNSSLPWYWPKDIVSHLWGFTFCLVDVWHIHWSCSAIFTEEISSQGNLNFQYVNVHF